MRRKVVNAKKLNKQNKNYFKIKLTSIAIIMTLVTTCTSLGLYEKYEKNRVKHENVYGYEDIQPWDVLKIKSDNFVILDAGDYNTMGTVFLDKKIEICNEKDISVGLVINSEADTLEKIYNDVELAKSIVLKHKIDYPVYLNIDKIIENDDLDMDMKTKIIKSFLQKCQSNNIYVGIQGKDSNLYRVKKFCEIVDYDAFLIKENESDLIKYDGNCTLVKELDGTIHSKENLATIITDKNLNDANNFYNDGRHIVGKDETILDISCQYRMSVNELLSFNDIKKEDIKEGMTLRIPTLIDKSIPNINNEKTILEDPLLGCDISYAQGTNIDWNKMNENFEFVIARISQGTKLDNCFENNIKNCNYYNIPVGVYCFNDVKRNNLSDDDFRKECEEQADFVIQNLSNKRIDYPVYLDIENVNGPLNAIYSKEDINILLDVWYEKMLSNGYEPGLYTGMDAYKYISNWVDYNINDKFNTWIAGGTNYDEVRQFDEVDVLPNEYNYQNKTYNANIRQVSQAGINAGAGNGLGHLDINYSYVDYSNMDKGNNDPNDSLFGIKEFTQLPNATQVGILAGTGGGASLLLASAILIARNKKRKSY